MNDYIGESIKYVIIQERPEAQDGIVTRMPLQYNDYLGAFSHTTDILLATMFEDKNEAIRLANLQNQISVILKQDVNYIVVENHIKRTVIDLIEEEVVVEEDPIEEPIE